MTKEVATRQWLLSKYLDNVHAVIKFHSFAANKGLLTLSEAILKLPEVLEPFFKMQLDKRALSGKEGSVLHWILPFNHILYFFCKFCAIKEIFIFSLMSTLLLMKRYSLILDIHSCTSI